MVKNSQNSIFLYLQFSTGGSSSVGRASASQAEGREFESRFPLKRNQFITSFVMNWFLCFQAVFRCNMLNCCDTLADEGIL
jgi:hypothetical protein